MFHRPKTDEPKAQPQEQQKAPQKIQQKKPEQDSFVKPESKPVQPENKPAQSFEAGQQARPAQMMQNVQQTSQQNLEEEKVMNSGPQQQQENNSAEQRQSQGQPQSQPQPMEAPAGAPFQRPPQMQRSVPVGFSGHATSPSYDTGFSAEDRRLVIGKGITMSGEIEACDYLLVEGTLEAALKGAKVLEVAESGVFYGAVEIEEATIAGRFEGELTVHGRITIKSGGSVTGSISYKELAVEAGAVVDGKLSPLAAVAAQGAQPNQQKKSMSPRNDNTGEESEGGELPFSGSAAAAAE